MGKGSGRRSGTGYEDGWSRIFDKKYKQEQQAKNAELRAMLDAMPLAKPVKCTEPFCQCEPGKCEWAPYDDKDDGK